MNGEHRRRLANSTACQGAVEVHRPHHTSDLGIGLCLRPKSDARAADEVS